jgi:hypothetical protein
MNCMRNSHHRQQIFFHDLALAIRATVVLLRDPRRSDVGHFVFHDCSVCFLTESLQYVHWFRLERKTECRNSKLIACATAIILHTDLQQEGACGCLVRETIACARRLATRLKRLPLSVLKFTEFQIAISFSRTAKSTQRKLVSGIAIEHRLLSEN